MVTKYLLFRKIIPIFQFIQYKGHMIPRYTRKEIEKIWNEENKISIWNEIECLIVEKLCIDGIIPKISAKKIRENIDFDIKKIKKIEKKTKHDFVAYIENVSEYIGKDAKYFHYGITSSDIIDTSFSIQLKQSADIIIKDLKNLKKEIKSKAIKYKNTIMTGRTHGIHAEPITFGLKLLSFYAEFSRNLERMENAKKEISVCAISGPVGTYNSIKPEVEQYVAKKLELKCETISTQIIPRDRHANFFLTLGIIASSVERMATEIRNLQKTELFEVEEYFAINQKGSSAMPHKRNPILSENLTGLSRYIRSSVIPSLENITLWHERDISHSSNERILAPDITITTDFILNRLVNIIKNLVVYPKNMKKNLETLKGLNSSQNLMIALINKGLSRKDAYKIIQTAAKKSWTENRNLIDILKKDKKILKYFNNKDLKTIFTSTNKLKHINYIFKKVLKI